MNLLTIIILIVIVLAFNFWNAKRIRRNRTRLIDSYVFPEKIKVAVKTRYPHLTDNQLKSVIFGLRVYFHLSSQAKGKYLAMPSQVVDVAWHEFILFTRLYKDFCNQALGRFLHHTPAEAMSKRISTNEGIKRTWRLSCQRENISPTLPERLPTLFAMDALLNIEDGFKYSRDCKGGNSYSYCASDIGCSADSGGGWFDSADFADGDSSGCGSCGGD